MSVAVSRVSAAVAEGIVTPYTANRIQVRVHDDDPGAAGTSNAAPGVDPAIVEAADWGSFGDDPELADYGGRVLPTSEIISFGEAADSGTARWISLWVEDDPDGAPGVYDVWIKNIELEDERAYEEDSTLRFLVGALELFGSGRYPLDEGS